MAEILVYYRDPAMPGRQVGDIIHVLPDGAQWGGLECVEDFVVVRVLGMRLEDAQAYTGPLLDAEGGLIAKSRYWLDLNAALDYDTLALIYCEDWLVPEVDAVHIKDKAA